MSKLTGIVNNIIAKTNTNSGDILTNSEAIATKTNTSLPLSTQLKGTFSLSNTVKTLGFDAITYTGNGTSQEIVTGVSTIDFTQASNGTGYYHDRVAGDCIVKNDAGTVIESGSIAFKDVAGVDGVCKVHIKCRDYAYNHRVYDGIRGANRTIYTDLTNSEFTDTDSLMGFTSNGFELGADAGQNLVNKLFVAYVTLYTHIKWGLTSQGKRYIEAYNPVTNDTMIMYQGSGVAGHQIPHSVGVELDSHIVKGLTDVSHWAVLINNEKMYISNTNASEGAVYNLIQPSTSTEIRVGESVTVYNNTLNKSYVFYGKAKSKTWTIVPYTGTGSAGNFVETPDSDGVPRRPARVIIKAVSGTTPWIVLDYARGGTNKLALNSSVVENDAVIIGIVGQNDISFNTNGFTTLQGYGNINGSGVQYIALVEFDTDNTGTSGSYFDNPTDTTNLQLADGLFSISKGYNANGVDNVVVSKSGTLIPSNGWED
jgi:hypothetical protein